MQDPNTSRFSFALLSDLHLNELDGMDKFHQVLEDLKNEKDLAFVHLLGDLGFDGALPEFKQILETCELPYHVTLGNHDVQRIGDYQDAFGAPYYSYEHGDYLFVNVFNAAPAMVNVHAHHGELDGEQLLWARALLQQAMEREREYKKIFLLAHVPPLQPGSPMFPGFRMTVESTDMLYDLCREFMIDACFYGHTHINEAFEYEDTWHITTPSLNWNFNTSFGYLQDDWIPTNYGGYRVVRVEGDEISDEMRWTHRDFNPLEL